MTSYGIYNPDKELKIFERLHGLQNILQAKLITIHKILKMNNKDYINEPIYIFTNSINPIYPLLI